MTELRCVAEMEKRGSPGAASSMLKIKATELSQQITEVAVEAAAYYGVPYQPETNESLGRIRLRRTGSGFDRHSRSTSTTGPRRSMAARTKYKETSSRKPCSVFDAGTRETHDAEQTDRARSEADRETDRGLLPDAIESGHRSRSRAKCLCRTLLLSLDPANRAWMQGATYRGEVHAGTVMPGFTLAEVVASNDIKFKAGDLVEGDGGWQQYFVEPGKTTAEARAPRTAQSI